VESIVAILDEAFTSLSALCATLSPDDWQRATDNPGWNVHDTIAHIVGTESGLLGRQAPGEPIDAPHVKNPIGAANEAWVESRRSWSNEALLAEFREVTAARMAMLSKLPAERFDEVGWSPIGEVPYRLFMSVRVMDIWVHEQDIRMAIGEPGNTESSSAAIAVGRFIGGLGGVIARRAHAPDGSTVVITVTGTAGQTLTYSVADGKAHSSTGSVDHPTVWLTFDVETFYGYATARPSASRRDRVRVVGDHDLAERILASMCVMI
jgi:uncharacterized protein (TIGR03083 family)